MHTAEHLAAQYLKGKGQRPTSVERHAFSQWLQLRFNRIRQWVEFTPEEVSPDEMLEVWESRAILIVSTAHNNHPHWLPIENAWFRAVHDWDHIQSGCGFDFAGETCAAGIAMATAPDCIKWILWSEIALQAAASIHTGSFQRQKLVKV